MLIKAYAAGKKFIKKKMEVSNWVTSFIDNHNYNLLKNAIYKIAVTHDEVAVPL